MRKGILEYCILLIISKQKIYTLDILKELEAAGFDTKEGTLYPLLNRLKRQGILGYEWVESNEGPPRKYYTLTDIGQKSLIDLKTSFDQTFQSIQTLQTKFK